MQNHVVHIAFGESAGGSINMMLKQTGGTQKKRLIVLPELFSIGPLQNLEIKEGRVNRYEWLKTYLNDRFHELGEIYSRFEDAVSALSRIQEQAAVFMWTGDHAHEQTGLRFVHHILRQMNLAVFHLNTSQFFPHTRSSGELNDAELRFIYEQGDQSALTAAERRDLAEEWTALSQQTSVLRVWEDGRIKSVKEDFYDSFIIGKLAQLQKNRSTNTFINCPRLIGEVIGHLEENIGDEFIEYRILELIRKGIFEMEGLPKGMRYFSIRLRSPCKFTI
ncbi:hypothetical protein BHT95_12690 [Bacillus paralicheniformis]|uniref:DUF1835 domain-containing protein n=1 Tax=Bacillus TaxID=1386 RepID=UPI0003A762EE|nr:DUF1835 domain-containing protein [Bacillus paralicheniformis]MSO00209.1 DUF1835 domain-containing protein [Bacillus paralicheniformis]MSO04216.1 DUF1835 domain-containing protein [Bacillus paralicheniformis]MSO08209.1 DUF1835 domain-containing protein [Bacillus paralicheniformis]MSO12203.1 DUF1835 domain-containing protein [Bacillus paralicheniformis]NJE38356.1 DUF1835 domain-containing protein [Bacillus paralicheniformis]